MSLQEKVIKELGFGMNMPNEPDVAFIAIWLSRKQDGHLSPTFCAMYEEPVPEEIKAKIADVLKYYAERILEIDPPVIDTAQQQRVPDRLRDEAKLSERKTVHEWLNDAGIPSDEYGKPICLLRRLRIAIDMLPKNGGW